MKILLSSFEWPPSGSGGGGGGGGDVNGPAGSTDNAIARFDGATGKVLKNSTVTIDGSGNALGFANVTATGDISGVNITGTGAVSGANVTASSTLSGASASVTGTATIGTVSATNVTVSGVTTLNALNASRALITNATKEVVSSSVTDTELSYLSGVTSSIQTQINSKITGPASATDNAVVRFDLTTGKLTKNSGVIIDNSNNITGVNSITANSSGSNDTANFNHSGTGDTLQIDHSGSGEGINVNSGSVKLNPLTASRVLQLDANKRIESSTITNTELGYLSGSTSQVVTINNTQSLTNKTFTDAITLAEIATPTTPASGNGKIYFKNDGFLYQLNDDGSESKVGAGSGGINYIDNFDFESNAAGWARYADAAGAAPVDGTGGTADITFDRSTVSPLLGLASGLMGKDAVNRQGQGISYDFTIDPAYQTQVLSINFNYTVSTSYADGDCRCYIYDVTNSVLIEPSQRDILANSGNAQYIGFFQAAANSTSYRLIVHIASTNASAYDFKLDNVFVGPAQAIESGNVVSFNAVKTANQTGVNPNLSYVKITFPSTDGQQGSGYDTTNSEFVAPESGTYFFNSAIGISSTNILANQYGLAFYKNGTVAKLGQVTYAAAGVTFYVAESAMLYLNKGDKVDVRLFGAGNNSINTLTVSSGGSSTYFSGFKIASDQASAGSSVVACRAKLSSNQTGINTNNTLVKINLNQVTTDTSGAFNTSTNRYVIPESGFYSFSGVVGLASTNVLANGYLSAVYKNGSPLQYGTLVNGIVALSLYAEVNGQDYFNKGDFLELYFYGRGNNSASTLTASATETFFSVSKLSSPAIIPPTEFVGCRYNTNAGQSMSSITTIVYENRNFDTTNSYNTTTGEYIVPVSGKYLCYGSIRAASRTWVAGNTIVCFVYVNATAISRTSHIVAAAITSDAVGCNNSAIVDVKKGDVITIRGLIEGNPNLNTNLASNYMTIVKVG